MPVPVFEPNKDKNRIETIEPEIEVTFATKDTLLTPGVHTFELIVIDSVGNESDPKTLQITVKDSRKPTAVLELAPPTQQPVEFGSKFTLTGAKSHKDPPGQIAKYRWTLRPT